MIAPDFPCKACTHLAEKHYTNIATNQVICIPCINGSEFGDETCREFIPDNIKFIELKQKKQELLNE